MAKQTKAPEAELISKIRGMIDHLYPGIEEEMREVFVHENEDAMKIITRKVDFRLDFHAWFLLLWKWQNLFQWISLMRKTRKLSRIF